MRKRGRPKISHKSEYTTIPIRVPSEWYVHRRETIRKALMKQGYKSLSEYLVYCIKKLIEEV